VNPLSPTGESILKLLGNSLTKQEKAMPISKAQKVRNMLDKDIAPKDIATKLKISTQAVYNIRYQHNKKNGLGSLRVRRPKKTQIVVPQESRSETITIPTGIISDQEDRAEIKKQTDLYPIWWLALIAFMFIVVVILLR
jgi:hypothetical protein